MEKRIGWDELKEWLENQPLGDFDLIVAVARGGLVPAALISSMTGTDMAAIWINLRDENREEKHEKPRLMREKNFNPSGKRILLVDDMSRTGKTLTFAKKHLDTAKEIKTLVLSGKSDYSFLPSGECIEVPWTSKSCSGE